MNKEQLGTIFQFIMGATGFIHESIRPEPSFKLLKEHQDRANKSYEEIMIYSEFIESDCQDLFDLIMTLKNSYAQVARDFAYLNDQQDPEHLN